MFGPRETQVMVGRRGGGITSLLRPLSWMLAVIGVVLALGFLFGQFRDMVMLASPDVQRAQVQAQVAEANHRTAELERETATIRAQRKAEAAWEPWMVGVEHAAVLGLVVAVPLSVLLLLIAGVALFRRHLSLPTRDGRVPLVGLDRELSAEALFRFQQLQGSGGFKALPASRELRSRRELEELVGKPELLQRNGKDG